MNDAGLLAALGIVGSCVAGLIWVIKRMFNDILPALKHLTAATEQNTAATKSADEYLKQRNGRDNEMHDKNIKVQETLVEEMKKVPKIIYSTQEQRHKEGVAVLEAIQLIPETMKSIAKDQAMAIIKAVSVKEQHVEHQQIEHVHLEQAAQDELNQ